VRLGGKSAVTAAYDNFLKERNLHSINMIRFLGRAIRIAVLFLDGLVDHGFLRFDVEFDEVHFKMTFRERIGVEMGYEMRHVVVELHDVLRHGFRRSRGMIRGLQGTIPYVVGGVALLTIFVHILGRADGEDSHKMSGQLEIRRAVKLTW